MNDLLTQPVVANTLNRVLRIVCRSLPMYLAHAKPWSAADDRAAQTAVARMAADARLLAGRVAMKIQQYGGQPDPGPFPSEFAALNDVGIEYVLRQIIDRARRDIDELRRCAADLAAVRAARDLAEEALGNLQGHVDLLSEITSVAG